MKEGQNFHYHGDRTRDHLVDYAERMSLPPINIVEDKYMMKDIMKNQDTFFIYVGTNSGPVWVSLSKWVSNRTTSDSSFLHPGVLQCFCPRVPATRLFLFRDAYNPGIERRGFSSTDTVDPRLQGP